MLHRGDRVIVALSGGADSSALLHFLTTVRKEFGFDIYACHVNHQLRGKEADKDESFTRELCKKLDVKLFVLRADVAAEAKRLKISTELCGREIRYQWFERKANELDAKIATAHTASDQLETILLNLTRGSGLAGLCGIPPVRGNIIRPLIEVTREEVEAYCLENGISYVTDSTNLTRAYTRNRLRLDAVPVLKSVNPSVERTAAAQTGRLREVQDFLQVSASGLLTRAQCGEGYAADVLKNTHPALRHEAFRLIFAEYAIIPEAKHIELLDKIVYNGGALELKRDIFAVCREGVFYAEKKAAPVMAPVTETYPMCPGETLEIQHKIISTAVMNIDEFHNHQKNEKFLFHNSLDYDTIPLTVHFRTRRPGDVFSPAGRHCTKTVKKLMTELKIPQEQRGSRLLLAEGSRILWFEGIGAAQRCRISPDTRRVLVIDCRNI